MLIKLGYQIYQFHERLKKGKDKAFRPLVKIIPQWTLPNHVTLLRFIVLLIWFPFAIFRPTLIQVLLFFIIGFFDLLDGALAHLRNQITYFGKYFDVFTDKLNHVALFLVVWGVTNHQLAMVRFFIAWDLFLALYVIVEYFSKSDKSGLLI